MKFLTLFILFLSLSQLSYCQYGQGKQRPKGTGDKNFEDIQAGYNQLLGMLQDNPNELEYIENQYDIKFYEYVLQGVLRQHFEEYVQSYKIQNGEADDIPEDAPYQIPSLQDSEKYINLVIKKIFGVDKQNSIKSFTDILKQPVVQDEDLGINKIQDLPSTKDYKIQALSQVIMEQYHENLFDDDDKEGYLENLKESLDNVTKYYVEYRDVDEKEIKKLFRLNKRLNTPSAWAQKYFSDPSFQKTVNQLLNSDADLDTALSAFINNSDQLDEFLSGDEENWDELSKQAHQIAQQNDIDTDEIDYMLEKYREKQQQDEEKRKREEQEERNKKHDSTILMVIGFVMGSIALFCVLRHLRQKKLQRDSMRGQSGYHQEL